MIISIVGGANSAILPDTIRLAVGERNYSTAIAELKSLRTTNEREFVANDLDYLLARIAEFDGQTLTAVTEYRKVATRRSVLRPFALMHLSQIARSTGNLLLERIWLNELAMMAPMSFPARSADLRIALNYFESGSYAEAALLLNNSEVKGNQAVDAGRDIKAVLGESYLRSGQTAKAREIFGDLIVTMPNLSQPDDAALKAVRGMDLIAVGSENYGTKAPDLPEAETLQRARIYQFNRDFARARLHFESLIANYPISPNTPDAVFQIGRGAAQKGDYTEAIKWFERVLEQYPETPTAKDALLQVASAYSRVGRPKEALNRYHGFIEKYPKDEKLDRAYLNPVDIYRDLGNDSDALKWCSKTAEEFKGKIPEALAIFAAVRIRAAKEDWGEALVELNRLREMPDLGGVTVPGGTSLGEVTFLRASALENVGRLPEAIDIYLSIPDGRGEYYGWRATERLRALADDEAGKAFVSQKIGTLAESLKNKDAIIRRAAALGILRLSENNELKAKALAVLRAILNNLPNLKADTKETGASNADPGSDRLNELGLYDEAVYATNSGQSGSPANLAAAKILSRSARADRAIAFIEPIWKKMPADIPLELIPRGQLELLYPAPFEGELLRFAGERQIDPRLLLAIMRQESRFQVDAKSYAAARGLMQFISSTAEKVADELEIHSFRQDDLYSHSTSILLGSQYVAGLFKIFPGQTRQSSRVIMEAKTI